MTIKVCVSGADGSMGSLVVKNILKDPELKLVGAITMKSSPNIGKDAGDVVGLEQIGVKLVDNSNLDTYLDEIKSDIYVDFTIAEALQENIKDVLKNRIGFVIGTTGISDDLIKYITNQTKEQNISGIIAPNMAIGVNVFFKMAQTLTNYLQGFDIEIIEAHHNRKRDAPSGTALKAATLIAEELNKDIDKIGKFGRKRGPEKREIGEIGVHAIRAGDIVGEHTIIYAGAGERLELTHRAHSRQCFAEGAVAAIKYIDKNKNQGKLFDMFDVLSLK
ncbi:MAG: 4-hydroxy-tetrahydrodipicolinate reductase [Promethearchaeota archaeon]|nr:MAG: 4-hydroxy-tetrahydrodipicolinate reductase [Candidatus Lokiarchaeota archaeon]